MRTKIPCFLSLLLLAGVAQAQTGVDAFLREGKIREGLAAFARPKTNADAFSLALLQTLDGVQHFTADLAAMGLQGDGVRRNFPFFRMAPGPGTVRATEPATPEKVAEAFLGLRAALRSANKTLAAMKAGTFGVEVDLATIRLDLDGDGVLAENEFLLKALGPVLGFRPRDTKGVDLSIRFDESDAVWLQGYTHLLDGMLTLLMAYDWRPVWNQSAHLFFKEPLPMPAVAQFGRPVRERRESEWADLIASLHEMRLDLVHPQGPSQARDSILAAIACSRVCWARIQAETDDDREWLPSATQTGPNGTKVSAEQIKAWHLVLDEMEAVLEGRKLLPHWRASPGLGLRLDKILLNPPKLDPVLLIQGSSLVPYLEEGEVSDRLAWRELQGPFGRGFLRFALWSN